MIKEAGVGTFFIKKLVSSCLPTTTTTTRQVIASAEVVYLKVGNDNKVYASYSLEHTFDTSFDAAQDVGLQEFPFSTV